MLGWPQGLTWESTQLPPGGDDGNDKGKLQLKKFWLVVSTPLKKICKSIGMMTFPIYGKLNNVLNHQPVFVNDLKQAQHELHTHTTH